MGVNATADMPGTQYLVSKGRNVLYPPKFVKIVIELSAELMRTVQPAFAVQARHRDSPRESVIGLILHDMLRHPVLTFRLCLKGKGKGFPYSITSVGPGADPGVQAVSLQVTVKSSTRR